MARYYFNLYNDVVTEDHEGQEFADDASALARARHEVRALAADSVSRGRFVGHHRVEVANAAHQIIGTIRFDDAVTVS